MYFLIEKLSAIDCNFLIIIQVPPSKKNAKTVVDFNTGNL